MDNITLIRVIAGVLAVVVFVGVEKGGACGVTEGEERLCRVIALEGIGAAEELDELLGVGIGCAGRGGCGGGGGAEEEQ